MKMNKNIPELRFQEFKGSGEWQIKELGELAEELSHKVGSRKYKFMSITSGKGLVSQVEKFGREIAGSSYRNYIVLRKGDFAYNKSSTKMYPEGEIARLETEEHGAVPNSIFTCFRFDEERVLSDFAKFPFMKNVHGKWLRKFISVGARANGALQVNTKDLFCLPFAFPSLPEQQKIADCLSSLDDLLKAETEKLEALRAHKKGLMQQLFPAEGARTPAFRFPEFRGSGDWESSSFGKLFSFKTTNSFSRDHLNYESGHAKNIHYGDIHKKFSSHFDISKEVVPYINVGISLDRIKEESYCREGDLVFADASEDVQDIGKCIELISLNGEKILAGLHTILARPLERKLAIGFGGFLFMAPKFRLQLQRESQGTKVLGISATRLSNLEVLYPTSLKEQEKITDSLLAADKLIKEQSTKLEQMHLHKKGLIQGLFPYSYNE
ncbi:MAG: restriction endonuclease subunit S [Chitinophagaceae bacterium]